MDSSGSVQAQGWIVEKEFVISLISTAIPTSSTIGIVQFATNAWIRYELFDDQNRTKILQTVFNLDYTRGWTYMKDAVTEAIWLFENQSLNNQRRLVLITDGNPMPVSQTPCALRAILDELDVDVMIIGVGASWTRARIDCLVHRDSDIIEVDAFTNDAFEIHRNLTDEFLCRDVTFTLTEIKPSLGVQFDPAVPYHPVPFVEFYNDVKDMDLRLYDFKIDGTFRGDISVTNIVRSVYGSNWPYGTYLVIYDNINDNGRDTAWCYDCVCDLLPNNRFCNESIYISMPGSYDSVRSSITNWNVVIYDATDIIQRRVMTISYGMGVSSDWIVIRDGFTYELREKSCNPTDGKCWKESCTVYGTPGHLPIDCEPNTCSDDNCQIGGDENATCNITTSLCDCKDWCYNIHNIPTCNCVVPPINCSIILNTNIDNTGLPAGDASWNKPNIDWSNVYTVWYEVKWYTFQNDEHELKIQATPVNQRGLTLFNMEYRNLNVYRQEVRAIVDFGDNANTPNIIESGVYQSNWTVCKLLTMEPTSSPTPAPTLGLPPIDRCNVTIRPGQNGLITIDVEWTPADVSASHTFNRDQFKDVYKLYFTQMDVWLPGTDNLAVRAWKVNNQTFYAESLPYDYNSTQLVHDGKVEVKVSVVVHEINDSTVDLDKFSWFDDLMYAQATVCEWFTHSPTVSPTHAPSISPSNDPTLNPSLTPTMSPTYSWWVLEGCVITIINNDNNGNDWIITWIESDPLLDDPNLPDYRRIYIYIDDNDNEFRILNQNQFSPQIMSFSSQIHAPNITNIEIKLIARHLTQGSDSTSLQFSPNIALCEIVTMSPTNSPTNAPTTPNPSHGPIIDPTTTPSISPTKSPTYNFPIDWCIVLIKDNTAYNITFKIPKYKTDGTTPSINEVKYMINYAQTGRKSYFATQIGTDMTIYSEILSSNGIIINYETEFKMTTVNSRDTDLIYADWTKCIIETMNPTIKPTISPSNMPTISPTNPDVGVFVYSDDETVCLGYERCACHLDKSNYNCIGSYYPEESQIEDTYLYFFPSTGVQMRVLRIGRYPYYLQYNTIIEWEFIYLNNTIDFNYGQRIKPIRGITTIRPRQRLGEIVFAEFVPIANEANIDYTQWYKFKIINCRTYTGNNYNDNDNEYGSDEAESRDINDEYISCGPIYPSWAYIIWVPPEAYRALLIGGGEAWPDWIFYLLLGASVTAVTAAYIVFVYLKNRNLKNNVDDQDQAAQAMLKGIASGSHGRVIQNTND